MNNFDKNIQNGLIYGQINLARFLLSLSLSLSLSKFLNINYSFLYLFFSVGGWAPTEDLFYHPFHLKLKNIKNIVSNNKINIFDQPKYYSKIILISNNFLGGFV
jgi:hypothetical protein